MSIEDKVIKIIAEKLSVDPADVQPESFLVDNLGADSLDLVELIMAMEDEFGLVIGEDEAENIKTVQDAVDYIKSH